MLIPQFSLKSVLLIMAVLAVVSLIATQSLQGSYWALGVSMVMASLVASLAVYAALFFIVWLASTWFAKRVSKQERQT